jgi:glycosyltransferase involved in cell wall biosynthesis
VRIAVDCTVVSRPGGIAVYAQELVGALGRSGRARELVLWCGSTKAADTMRAALPPGARVVESSIGPRLGYLMHVPALNPFSVERLMGEADILHGPNYFLPAHRGRARTVVTVHDLSALRYPEWHPWWRVSLHRAALPATVARVDHVITSTEATRDEIIARFRLPSERVTAVPLGFSPIFRPRRALELKPVLERHGLVPGDYVCYVGGVEPRKNLQRLLSAYTVVRSRSSSTPPLVVAGFAGWHDRNLREQFAAAGVKDLGPLAPEDVAALIAGCAAFAYPSLYEGFGLPVLEAMASGVPVVASTDPAIREVAGSAALLVDPREPEAIAEALERILTDSQLSTELRRDGLRRAASFSWDRTAAETLDVYERTAMR